MTLAFAALMVTRRIWPREGGGPAEEDRRGRPEHEAEGRQDRDAGHRLGEADRGLRGGVDRFELQRGTAVGSGILVSLSTLFPHEDFPVSNFFGGRYGGNWSMAASLRPSSDTVGQLTTERGGVSLNDPRYPDLALESAFIWLMAQAKKHGWRVLFFENHNERYAEAERPYFVLAQAILGNASFKPKPGVKYADEGTLDEAVYTRYA